MPYWRQNLHNAGACVPILLELRAGRLGGLDREGASLFDAGVQAELPMRIWRDALLAAGARAG